MLYLICYRWPKATCREWWSQAVPPPPLPWGRRPHHNRPLPKRRLSKPWLHCPLECYHSWAHVMKILHIVLYSAIVEIYCQNQNSFNSSAQLSLRLDYILTCRSTHPPRRSTHPPQTLLFGLVQIQILSFKEKSLDQIRTLNSHITTTTTNCFTSSRAHMKYKVNT